MDDGGCGEDFPFPDTPDMIGRYFYPADKKLLGIQEDIASRAAHTFGQGDGCASMQHPIGLKYPWGYGHLRGQIILPHIYIFNTQGFHEGVFANVVADRKNFFFEFVHALFFCKIKHSEPTPGIPFQTAMETKQKQVRYTATNSYLCLNTLTEKTRNVWMVFHGIGYLSRYFISYFKDLGREENYIIAPQAPSKYYLDNQYKHVGASWLTRENTEEEINNVLNYLNEVYRVEAIPRQCNLIVFGFSQGVSMATRWVARSKIPCSQLVLYAGGIPEELSPGDFEFLNAGTRITAFVGDADEYLSGERMKRESEKLERLFQGRAIRRIFKGGHEIQRELLTELTK